MNALPTRLQDAALVNPITMAFALAEGYQQLLQETLHASGLSAEDAEHVLAHMQDVGVDNRLLFSLNRPYAPSNESFEAFCRRYLSAQLFEAVYKSAAEGKRIERLHTHQAKGIQSIVAGMDTIVATGTGSGKTEAFLYPLLDHCLQNPGPGVKALIVYPMNALANDQLRRLADLVGAARADGATLRYGSFTGLTPSSASDRRRTNPPAYPLSAGHVVYRDDIRRDPPDILITNYVMLDRMLTSSGPKGNRSIFDRSADTLRYVVLDELHSYSGNNATHLRGLLRRLRHTLHKRPVFIGTSATLTSNASTPEGTAKDYLSKTTPHEVDAFIKPLFDTDDYCVVTPDYAPLPTPARVTPVTLVEDAAALGWALQIDERRGLDNLSRLLGKRFIEDDFDPEDGDSPAVVQALERDAFVAELTTRLADGPLTFREVVDVLRPLAPPGTPDVVALAKAYLSGIAFANQKTTGTAVLDFRIHLFLKDIGGFLQTCLRCRQYHSGAQASCGTCGWPLYSVHRHNVEEALGRVVGREMQPSLKPGPDEPGMSYLVRISRPDVPGVRGAEDGCGEDGGEQDGNAQNGSAGPDRMRVDDQAVPTALGLPIAYAPGGALEIHLLPRGTVETVGDLTVPLVQSRKTHQYLATVVETLLRSQSAGDRKLLAFIDNREKASLYEALLRDEFANSFYEDLLSLYRPELQMRDLPAALAFVEEEWRSENVTPLEKSLQGDFAAWVSRAIGRSPRKGLDTQEGGLLELHPPATLGPAGLTALTDFQREVVELFFNERAIDKRFLGDRVPDLLPGAELARKRDMLRVQRWLIGQHHGVHLGSALTTKQFSAVSLGPLTRTHSAFVTDHGADAVRDAIALLVDDGTSPRLPLVSYPVSADAADGAHVYLKPTWVRFAPRERGYTTYAHVQSRLLSGDLHSSDVLDDRRTDAETRFEKGTLDLLIATPTLEMGVDIGQLKSVLHIGVPPLPSNYAQRAGRAGRGRSDRYALITTFCKARSNHDLYYFDRPKEMVAGYISPPAFDPANEDVLRKHVHALVLQDWAGDGDALRDLAARADQLLPALAAEAHDVFGDAFDAASYVTGPFREALGEWTAKLGLARPGTRPVDLFYDINVFPDYGFRRDEVVVIDKTAAVAAGADLNGAAQRFLDGVLDRQDQKVLDRYRISGRAPEQAYRRLFPGQTVSMAGDDFIIGDLSPFSTPLDEPGGARSYSVLYGYRSDDLVTSQGLEIGSRANWLVPDPTASVVELEGLVQIAHHPTCTLSFRALADPPGEGTDQKEPFIMGYDLEREALVLSLPRALFSDDRLAISFLSAFDRAVKSAYGLDEGDLRLLVDVPMADAPNDETEHAGSSPEGAEAPVFPELDETFHAVLYDASGNGNAPLARVAAELLAPTGALEWAHRRLTDCPNEDCTRGCYLCVRSYSTHFYAGTVDRPAARMVIGYLIGKNAFEPALPLPPDPAEHVASTVLTIGLRDGVATARDGHNAIASVDTSRGQNDALYAAIAQGAAAAFSEGSQGLRIVVDPSVSYLTDLLNEGRVGSKAKRPEKEAFERMLFATLRYPSIRAVGHASL